MLAAAAIALTLGASVPPFLPTPKSVKLAGSILVWSGSVDISTNSHTLDPLARIFAREAMSGLQANFVPTDPLEATRRHERQIELRLMPGLKGEAYRIRVEDGILVEGGNYAAVAMGTATLLQAMSRRGQNLEIPCMTIEDRPDRAYRGLMVDVARKYHSIETLENCVELCRLYKIRYLQLHLTDDQAYTIPSRAYPKLNQVNTHGGPSYTEEELRGLVRYAEERGVTLVPELEVPGHAAAMIRAYPELFKIEGTKPYEHHATINFASERVLGAVETLVKETCAIFGPSPYFHIGGDEADYANADGHPDFQAAFRRFGLTGKAQGQIYRRFLGQMDEIVKRQGKRTIVWEGFGREPDSPFPIPKDIAVMEFESAYYDPRELVNDGHPTINAAWTPLYVLENHVWRPEKVLDWDLATFGRYSTFYPATAWIHADSADPILGAQVCAWEQREGYAIPNLRRIVPAMSERVWNVDRRPDSQEFLARLARTDELFSALLSPVRFRPKGLAETGPDDFDIPTFHEPIEVTLDTPNSSNERIRYTVDGRPAREGEFYREPIRVTENTLIRAIAEGPGGKPIGSEVSMPFRFVRPVQKSLATGRPVTVSGGTQGDQKPELAVDGTIELGSSWWAAPGPQWLQVDLGSVQSIGGIDVYPYWDGRRYYQYRVEASPDGNAWTTVVDRSDNTVPASAGGDLFKIAPTPARYVRITLLKGSANEGVHLVELHVWPAAE